jgi:hypothetical protein
MMIYDELDSWFSLLPPEMVLALVSLILLIAISIALLTPGTENPKTYCVLCLQDTEYYDGSWMVIYPDDPAKEDVSFVCSECQKRTRQKSE